MYGSRRPLGSSDPPNTIPVEGQVWTVKKIIFWGPEGQMEGGSKDPSLRVAPPSLGAHQRLVGARVSSRRWRARQSPSSTASVVRGMGTSSDSVGENFVDTCGKGKGGPRHPGEWAMPVWGGGVWGPTSRRPISYILPGSGEGWWSFTLLVREKDEPMYWFEAPEHTYPRSHRPQPLRRGAAPRRSGGRRGGTSRGTRSGPPPRCRCSPGTAPTTPPPPPRPSALQPAGDRGDQLGGGATGRPVMHP